MTEIYVVRHCEARGNIDRVFHGHTDSNISEKGAMQLELLADRFSDTPLDAMYSSPLKRARLTAFAVVKRHPVPIEVRDGLIEINGGYMEGRPWSDLPILNEQDAIDWNTRPHLFRPEGGESMAEVYDRIWDTVTGIAAENKGRRIGIATHGCAIRNLICRAEGRPIEELSFVDWCDNTAVSLLRFDDEMNCTVVFKNDISHLDEKMSTLAGQIWWKKENLESLRFD